jgi:hypothetical protein
MKKLFFLLAFSLVVFSCKDDFTDTEKQLLLSKEIPEAKAKEMKRRFKEQTTPPKIPTNYKFDWDIYNILVRENPGKVYLVPVIYGKDDEADYRRAWGLAASDSAGMVEGYSSIILQYGSNTEYYTMTKICPPPEPCMEEQ